MSCFGRRFFSFLFHPLRIVEECACVVYARDVYNAGGVYTSVDGGGCEEKSALAPYLLLDPLPLSPSLIHCAPLHSCFGDGSLGGWIKVVVSLSTEGLCTAARPLLPAWVDSCFGYVAVA